MNPDRLKRLVAFVPLSLARELKAKLALDDITFKDWLIKQIQDYLKK